MVKLTLPGNTGASTSIALFLTLLICLLCTSPARADELLDMSLEDLLNIEVTTASKGSVRLLESAAAVYVIDREDIQRSGANSIPELLKMVPGMHVIQLDSNRWAVSARGFNGEFANKLLVMIDGRSVYTPIFSGVYWDSLNLLLSEIDRIEVIRGPGAALWGANAVNGVINIITRPVTDTLGTEITSWVGTEERAGLTLTQSKSLDGRNDLRLNFKTQARDASYYAGSAAEDDMKMATFGLRWDHDNASWSGTTTASLYRERSGSHFNQIIFDDDYFEQYSDETDSAGGHFLTGWKHSFDRNSQLSLQLYYDYSQRKQAIYETEVHTVDADIQYTQHLVSGQKLSIGLNLRRYFDDLTAIEYTSIDPQSRDYGLYSLYLQDEIPFGESLKLILGSRFEYNDLSGWEVQPNIRLAWYAHDDLTLWGAISRAARTPSRMDIDGQILVKVYEPGHTINPSPFPALYYFNGADDFDSEEVISYELGLRHLATANLSLDIALFYNDYDKLRTGTEPSGELVSIDGIPTYILSSGYAINTVEGETWGVEAALSWQATDDLKLIASYSYMDMDFRFNGELEEFLNSLYSRHQASLQSRYDISNSIQFDTWLTYTGAIEAQDQDAIWDLSLRLGWQPSEDWHIELIGQNLLHDHKKQLDSEVISLVSTEIERSALIRASYRF